MTYFKCGRNTRLTASAKGKEEMNWYTEMLLARAKHADKQYGNETLNDDRQNQNFLITNYKDHVKI